MSLVEILSPVQTRVNDVTEISLNETKENVKINQMDKLLADKCSKLMAVSTSLPDQENNLRINHPQNTTVDHRLINNDSIVNKINLSKKDACTFMKSKPEITKLNKVLDLNNENVDAVANLNQDMDNSNESNTKENNADSKSNQNLKKKNIKNEANTNNVTNFIKENVYPVIQSNQERANIVKENLLLTKEEADLKSKEKLNVVVIVNEDMMKMTCKQSTISKFTDLSNENADIAKNSNQNMMNQINKNESSIIKLADLPKTTLDKATTLNIELAKEINKNNKANIEVMVLPEEKTSPVVKMKDGMMINENQPTPKIMKNLSEENSRIELTMNKDMIKSFNNNALNANEATNISKENTDPVIKYNQDKVQNIKGNKSEAKKTIVLRKENRRMSIENELLTKENLDGSMESNQDMTNRFKVNQSITDKYLDQSKENIDTDSKLKQFIVNGVGETQKENADRVKKMSQDMLQLINKQVSTTEETNFPKETVFNSAQLNQKLITKIIKNESTALNVTSLTKGNEDEVMKLSEGTMKNDEKNAEYEIQKENETFTINSNKDLKPVITELPRKIMDKTEDLNQEIIENINQSKYTVNKEKLVDSVQETDQDRMKIISKNETSSSEMANIAKPNVGTVTKFNQVFIEKISKNDSTTNEMMEHPNENVETIMSMNQDKMKIKENASSSIEENLNSISESNQEVTVQIKEIAGLPKINVQVIMKANKDTIKIDKMQAANNEETNFPKENVVKIENRASTNDLVKCPKVNIDAIILPEKSDDTIKKTNQVAVKLTDKKELKASNVDELPNEHTKAGLEMSQVLLKVNNKNESFVNEVFNLPNENVDPVSKTNQDLFKLVIKNESTADETAELHSKNEGTFMKIDQDIRNKVKKALVDLFIETTNNNSAVNSYSIEEVAFKTFMNMYGKELANQEEKYQQQIDNLTMKLAEKQQELSELVVKMQEVKGSSEKDESKQQLEIKLEELKRLIREKEAVTESVRVELQYTNNEADLSKVKMKKLQEDLGKAQESITLLQEQNLSHDNELSRSKVFEANVKKLEEDLKKSECCKKDLETTLSEIESERDEEMKIVQDVLDEAAQERQDLIENLDKELSKLNTVNTAREHQMLDDFEWKLREMEKEHKIKLNDKETQSQERMNAARSVVESELSESLTKVAEDRRHADEILSEVGHLRSYEAEVVQLRGVTHEFQKALRASAREMENMKIRERILDDEIRTLKKGAQTRQNTLQRVKRQTDEENARQMLNKMKSELNAEWEDKYRSGCSRLKSELNELHAEEKHLAVESIKVQKEQEIQTLKKTWENRHAETAEDVSRLKDNIAEKAAYYQEELDNQRTFSDRKIWDLRMKLQKLTESSFDITQQMEEKYRDETERSRVDYEERIQDLEQRLERYDLHSGVDIVAKLQKDHKIQMQYVGEQHQISMVRLREELECDKFQAVEEARVIITQHHGYIEDNLKEQLQELQTRSSENAEELESIRPNLTRKDETIKNLEEEIERLRDCKSDSFSTYNSSLGSSVPPAASTTSSGFSSQFSLASSTDSQGSRNSQDRYCNSEGILDNVEDSQKSGNGGLLGKVFGGGWFTPSKSSSRRGSTPLSNKKPYANS